MTNRRLLILGTVLVALGLLGMTAASGGDGWWPGGGPMMWMMSPTGADEDVPAHPPIAEAPTITVRSTEFKFDPDKIVMTSGESVNIRLINEGGVFHDLSVPDLGFRLKAQQGQETTGGLDVPAAGEYHFQCTVPGHAAGGMVGTLVVEEAAAQG
jgi:plastocyanin